ncbi:hypothetical protein SAMD00019534_075790 [Acytostelium subglobosum LB1]|uniref:hypothetical protein n=1 Tax=Acytostelium subglobosum LB1 TaxID=1410327 RepID=UPI0006450173|nr:hypothetical protein SAMD00019534_075790 [Acytostelium subglobosum LB1]GAM24404.1 hypothetical protein SAMD00019534_075790 [Acytostelium subglobosum LB1]|eukprot:XP_012752730.1 hypothetical protein SAMD00019534_075790 [Acytostelium subglobosum LB1]
MTTGHESYEYDMCESHNKRREFICLDCNELVCKLCLSASHKKHDVESADHIRELAEQRQYNDVTVARLRLLWSTLQRLATTHKSLKDTSKSVTESFKLFHQMLIAEEHRSNAPIIDRLQQTTTSIRDIVKEIKSINNLFRPSTEDNTLYNDSYADGSEEDDMVHTIASCSSMDQYIERSFPAPSSGQSVAVDGLIASSSDTQVLTMMQNILSFDVEGVHAR